MSKNLYFIGDDHETEGCIEYGLKKLIEINAIGPNTFVLLLEEDKAPDPIGKNEFAQLKSTILEDKPNGSDAQALKFLMDRAYLIYGFDGSGGAQSKTRHGKQQKNINYYVNEYKATAHIENFIIVVGDAHLKSKYVDWTPLQAFSYGDHVTITYFGADFLQK